MNSVLEQLIRDTVALLEAVAKGDPERAWWLANRVKKVGWAEAMPALASAAGAFQQSLEEGAASEREMSLAIQAIAYEVQEVVREREG